jgi:hypothetical protein
MKKKRKYKEERQFWEKFKKIKKQMWGKLKLKLNSQPTQY